MKPLGQAQPLPQPVQHQCFHLGSGGRRLPQHALLRQDRGDEIGQHRRRRGVGREIGEEARVLPMGQAGDDLVVDLGQNTLQPRALLGRVVRKARAHGARVQRGAHRKVSDLAVIAGAPRGNPRTHVGEFVPVHQGFRVVGHGSSGRLRLSGAENQIKLNKKSCWNWSRRKWSL